MFLKSKDISMVAERYVGSAEILNDGSLEKIYYPIPEACHNISKNVQKDILIRFKKFVLTWNDTQGLFVGYF